MQVWAQGRTLQVSSVFYALALLQARHLPALRIFTQHVCTAANNMFTLIGARTAPYTLLKSRSPVLPWEGSRTVVWHYTRWDLEVSKALLPLLDSPSFHPAAAATVHGDLLHACRGNRQRAAHLAQAAGRVSCAAGAAAAVTPFRKRRWPRRACELDVHVLAL